MEQGFYPELSSEAYHADPAIGSSGIKTFMECPALYEYEYLNPEKVKERASKHTSIGSHAHIALLEPELFAKTYKVAPKNAVVNKGKSNEELKPMNKTHGDWNAFVKEAAAENKTPILYTEYLQAQGMVNAINNHALAKAMLTGGRAEMSFFAVDDATGLRIKARPDYLVKVAGIGWVLVDYKTTAISMRLHKQSNHAIELGRHIQAAHHKRVTEIAMSGTIDEVVYITQMQEAPHLIRIFRMPAELIAKGEELCRENLDLIAQCKQNNIWPGFPQVIEDYIAPGWMK